MKNKFDESVVTLVFFLGIVTGVIAAQVETENEWMALFTLIPLTGFLLLVTKSFPGSLK